MGNRKNKEIVRCELESYVAAEKKSSSPNVRQADAIQKMMSLPEKNFDELVSDIVNEMRRRSAMPSSTPETPMQRKLCRIHEDGFKSLILDLLLVMSQRSPEDGCSPENVHGLIDNLDKLISSLKEDMINEEKMVQTIYSSHSTLEKVMLFIEYTRNVFDRNGEDTKLPEYMMKEIKEYSDTQDGDEFDLMFNADMLLNKWDRSKYSSLQEYRYHRSNIQRLEVMDLEHEVKKRLIRNEISQIYSLLATEDINLERVREKHLESRVYGLVDILSKIKDDAEEGKQIDAYEYLGDVAGSSEDILGLAENMGLANEAHLDHLKMKIASLEQIHDRSSNEEPLPAMFATIEAVKKVLGDISRGRGTH